MEQGRLLYCENCGAILIDDRGIYTNSKPFILKGCEVHLTPMITRLDAGWCCPMCYHKNIRELNKKEIKRFNYQTI